MKATENENKIIDQVERNRPERLMTREQLCDHFNVSLKTEFNWRKRGWLPYIKIGAVVMFDVADIIEFQRTHKTLLNPQK